MSSREVRWMRRQPPTDSGTDPISLNGTESTLMPEYDAYTQRFKDVVRLLSILAEQSQAVKQNMPSELDVLLDS